MRGKCLWSELLLNTAALAQNLDIDFSICKFIQAEMSLEKIGFFIPCLKSKDGTKTKISRHTLADGTEVTGKVTVYSIPDFGLPNTVDLDYYRAFQNILDSYLAAGKDISGAIEVPTKKLMRLANKQGGKADRERVKVWIQRMRFTGIQGEVYRQKDKQLLTLMESVFIRTVIKGQTFSDGTIAETNYVWLSPTYREHIEEGYTRPVDLEFHNSLTQPIAKSLYPLLETGWHATGHETYRKSYAGLCDEFMLTSYSRPSDISRQLGPGFQELKDADYLRAWKYPSKKDPSIYFTPGKRYFAYQEYREQRKGQWRGAERAQQRADSSASLSLTMNQQFLLEDVIAFCGESDNPQACAGYKNAVLDNPESVIRAALSEARLADHTGQIKKNRGAYFFDAVSFLKKTHNQN